MTVKNGLGFVLGKFSTSEFANEDVEESMGGFQFHDDGQTAAAMDGDDKPRSVRGGGANGKPVPGGKLLGAINKNKAGGFHFAELVRETFFIPHAALGREAEKNGLKTAGLDARDELPEQRCFSVPVSADDACAPLLRFDALDERFPIQARWKLEGQTIEFGSSEWIFVVGHGAKLACIRPEWE